MAPSEDSQNPSKDQTSQNHDPANPFVAFRKFADEQISGLISLAFVSNPFSSKPSASAQRFKKDYEAWLQESRDSRERLEREAGEAAGVMDLYIQAHKDASGERSVAKDDESGSPQCPYGYSGASTLSDQETRDICSSFHHQAIQAHRSYSSSRDFASSNRPLLPLSYLLYSTYYPIHLEQQKPFSDHGTTWRAAFEDLLDIDNGHGLSDHAHSRSNSVEAPHEWIQRLICLGSGRRDEILEAAEDPYVKNFAKVSACPGMEKPLLKNEEDQEAAHEGIDENSSIREMSRAAISACFGDSIANCRRSAKTVHGEEGCNDEDDEDDNDDDDDDYEDDEATELDLYERLLGLGKDKPPTKDATKSRVLAHLQHESSADTNSDSDKPSILSSLTTTEKTTLQDGTTHTKVVLKKRFSDGREESSETLHTQHALSDKSTRSLAEADKKAEANKIQPQEKKGWFWS